MPERESQSSWKAVICNGPLLLVLYVLSVGPAGWLFLHVTPVQFSEEARAVLLTVYAPLVWLCDKSDLCNSLYVWYVNYWIP